MRSSNFEHTHIHAYTPTCSGSYEHKSSKPLFCWYIKFVGYFCFLYALTDLHRISWRASVTAAGCSIASLARCLNAFGPPPESCIKLVCMISCVFEHRWFDVFSKRFHFFIFVFVVSLNCCYEGNIRVWRSVSVGVWGVWGVSVV